jgi:hypothetical protein
MPGRRAVTVDADSYRLTGPVRDAWRADEQDLFSQGVQDAISGMPDIVTAVTQKVATLTSDSAVSGLFTGSSTARASLPVRYLAGAGIDPTGASDSSAAVQAMLTASADGDTLMVPAGAVLRLNAGITISKRIRLTGGGELRFRGPGDATKPLVSITTDGVHLDGVTMTNPDGIQTYGVYVQANVFRATGNRIVGFQDGIQVAATGEYHDVVIASNQVLDIIGNGGGPSSNSSAGEAAGDGIVVWGAAATIVGNRVTCKAGRDARIGIHVESLATQETTAYAHADSLTTIVGNVITGQFRRGIVDEGVQHTTIVGNVIADATWWGIALIGLAHHSIVAQNTIKYTRTAADNQGSSATPIRAGVMLYCIQEALSDVSVSDNTIRAVNTATMPYGIVLQAHSSVTAGAARGLQIVQNRIWDESSTVTMGIALLAATTDVQILDNYVSRFTAIGISTYIATQLIVAGNRINGPGTAANVFGIKVDGGAAEASIDDNTIRDVATGIGAFFRTILTTANNNTIKNASVGIDLYQSSGTAAVNSNLFYNVAIRRQNLPANTVQVGNAPS